jgi:hypothetical protein
MAAAAGLEPLTAFIGEWDVEAEFPVLALTARGQTVFEWLLDGSFLVQRSEVELPEAPDSTSIVSPSADGDGFTQHYFDSRGVVRLYAMRFDDGVWTLLRTAPDFSPLPFSQRFTGTFADGGDTIRGRWEASPDGAAWERDFDITYRRRR